jgi:ferredoxin-NADP reductase
VSKAGGFTITSSPPLFPHSQSLHSPHIELAIQKSPDNPPAAWLWQEQKSILGRELNVRVGGSFVWPPELHLRGGLRRVVFVAGGVGINPLMSMLSSIAETKAMAGSLELGFEVILLYTTRLPPSVSQILFLSRLKKVFNDLGLNGTLKLFLTGEIEAVENLMEDSLGLGLHNTNMSFHRRRINGQDLDLALGEPETRSGTVAYVCGVPSMTDGFVEKIRVAQGMEKENILFEKWW